MFEVYGSTKYEAADMLKKWRQLDFAKIELGLVKHGELGMCVVRAESLTPIATGQQVNKTIKQLFLLEGAEVVLFFSKRTIRGSEMVVPTELACSTPRLKELFMQYRTESQLSVADLFTSDHCWF